MVVSTIRAYAVTFAVLMTLTGCGGASARTLTCTKEINGQCMQKTCTQSPENVPEVPFDCASYAAACMNAGEYWSGTNEGGTCTRVL